MHAATGRWVSSYLDCLAIDELHMEWIISQYPLLQSHAAVSVSSRLLEFFRPPARVAADPDLVPSAESDTHVPSARRVSMRAKGYCCAHACDPGSLALRIASAYGRCVFRATHAAVPNPTLHCCPTAGEATLCLFDSSGRSLFEHSDADLPGVARQLVEVQAASCECPVSPFTRWSSRKIDTSLKPPYGDDTE
jgi:hypothetical protein